LPSNFEQLIFEIIATDKNASAAFDRFRQKVDQTSKSVDDNSKSMDKNAKSIDNVGKSASTATPLLGGLGGASGMGLLIGAGVALSPILVTVGTGLLGFGAAAAGAVAPVLKASKAAGGLQANMAKLNPEQQKLAVSILGLGKQYHAFEQALQPQVLSVFGDGIRIAGHLMKDVEPIAKATGVALGTLLNRVDKEFQSGQWQSFFSWMAANVGPDFQQIGNLAIDLLKTLPTLLQDLQPVAHGFLAIADGAVKAADAYARFIQAQAHKANTTNSILDAAQDFLKYGYAGDKAEKTAMAMAAQQAALNQRLIQGHAATADLIHPLGTFTGGLQAAHAATMSEQTAVTLLTAALKGLSTGLLTSEQDQIAWRQAQHAANQALIANTASLDSNRNSALAARSAIIQSTASALTFAQQEVNVHHNVDAASRIIQDQIRWLQSHAAHSKFAAAEVDALRGALDKLKSKAVTITEKGVGHFSIFGSNTSSTPSLARPAATGYYVNRGTGPTADDVLIRASKGELIVPAKMVSAGLTDHLRGMIPGFAAGGLAGLPGQTSAFGAQFQSQFTSAMEKAMTGAMQSAISSSSGFGTPGPGGGNAGANAALARRMMPAWGSGAEWAAWNYVAMRESGWNQFARNPSSGAYGIPQALPPGKMGPAANPPQSNPAAQISWMIGYIRSTPGYGDPIGAARHEAAFNWYDQGGYLPVGLSMALNTTGKPERVGGGGGSTYVINIGVLPGGEREAGRRVVNAIKEFEKGAGKSWRT
jgi:hypothetical protein